MKAIRRSFKSEKDEKAASRHAPHPSLHAKAATAIIPPKRVIKALYDYEPANKTGHELAFHKGDFFHVLSREDDTEWYEACNPLIPSARGLVPVAFFEIIGKNQRQSGNSVRSNPDGLANAPHDSGFSEKGSAQNVNGDDKLNKSAAPRMPAHGRGGSTSRANAMVYGIVLYDFQAERPDELDAKAGEPIIVVAQSNPEWFVAKPIGRLGGPGLIPVSFVSIKDTVTGAEVTDPLEAVKAAGVPRVEEWKKTAADYKNSSISLGQINTPQVAQAVAGMDRMSLQNKQQMPPPPLTHQQYSNQSQNQPYQSQQQQPQLPLLAPVSASVPRYCFDNDMYWYIIEAQMEDGRWWELSRYYADFYDFQIALLEAFPEEAGNRGRARILPFMPGPVAHVTDAISNGRRQNLDEYIKKIVSMPPHISRSALVRKLFAPKNTQDYEIDPSAINEDYRLSGDGQSLAPTQSRQSEGKSALSGHQQQSPYGQNPPLNGSANHIPPPPLHTQASNLTQNSTGSGGRGAAQEGPIPLPPQIKLKVFHDGDLVALRVPEGSSFEFVKAKIMERIRVTQNFRMKWETGQNMQEVKNDQDLAECLAANPNPKFFIEYDA